MYEVLAKTKRVIESIAENLADMKALDENELEEIKEELREQKLKIAIVGQMKYGKTTFLNAFLFRKQFLPVSDTPMTATLTAIEHGEREKYEVEFFSEEDIRQLENWIKMQKDEILSDILQKLQNLKGEYSSFLGRKKRIKPEDIENYVGADGKYTPLVKTCKIWTNFPSLKDTLVVDTPGFNDPVKSREKISVDYLKQANAVIFFLYAGRPLDETDRHLIIDALLKRSTTARVILVLNKIDVIGTDLDKVRDYINRELKKAVEEIKNEYAKEILEKAKIVPVSSLLALLGRLSLQEIEGDENLRWYYENFVQEFNLKGQRDFEEKSNIKELERVIKDILLEDKIPLVLESSKRKLFRFIDKRIEEKEEELTKERIFLRNLELKKEEIEKKLEKLEEVRRKLGRKVKIRGSDCLQVAEYEISNACEDLEEEGNNQKKEVLSRIRRAFDENNRFLIGLNEDKFALDVESRVKSALLALRGEYIKLLKNTRKELRKAAIDFVKDLIDDFSEIYRERSVMAILKDSINLKKTDEMTELRGKIVKEVERKWREYYDVEVQEGILEFSFGLSDLIDILLFSDPLAPLKVGTFKSDRKCYEEATKFASEMIQDAVRTYRKQISNISHEFEKTLGVIEEKFKEAVLEPITKGLQEAKEKDSPVEKARAMKKAKEKIIKLEEEIKHLEKAKKYLDSRLKEFQERLKEQTV